MKFKSLHIFLFLLFFTHILWAQEDDLRIGIIGAGPAGLTAAWELKKKGYTNVVVLEEKAFIGGKVKTYMHNGLPYELGAVITAPDYDIILTMAADLDLKLHPTPPSITCKTNGKYESMTNWAHEKYGWSGYLKLGTHHAKFAKFVWQHKDFFEPGFAHTPKNMHTNFEDFMHEQGMEAVLEAHRPIMVGCGYGYAEDQPAPYWMKLMKTFAYEYTKSMLYQRYCYGSFNKGWQNLWQELVKRENINVVLSSRVLQAKRRVIDGQDIIKVRTANKNYEFDRLIITIPHLANNFLELNVEEELIFSRVKTIKYKVTLAEIDGLQKNSHIWLRENSYKFDSLGNLNDGKPVLLSSNQNTNVYQIYQFSETNKSDNELRAILEKTVHGIGGILGETITEEIFDYFPHFNAADFKEGIPELMLAQQGKQGIFYTGALMDFEIVERAAAHAKQLVEQYF